MFPLELRLDDFVQFLVDHSGEIVGYSGLTFFRNPLAEWLAVCASSCFRGKGFLFMGWNRLHHQRTVKPVRHAWVSLRVPHCQDCGNELPVTHQFSRFESRCFSCWSVFSRVLAGFSSSDGSSQTASQ